MNIIDYLETKLTSKKVSLHLEHLEDLMFNDVYSIKKIKNFLGGLISKDISSVTVKYDGRPAVIFGIDPANDKFFIGTKRVFTRPAYSIDDIEEIYSDAENIKAIFKALYPKLKAQTKGKKMYVGDLMFYPGIKKINDNKISFKPNTITYVVDTSSNVGKEILKKQFGLVIHTELNGPSITAKGLAKKPFNNLKDFNTNGPIWIANANLYPDKKRVYVVDKNVIKQYEELKQIFDIILLKPEFFDIVSNYSVKFKSFIAHLIKTGSSSKMFSNINKFNQEAINFLKSKYKSEKFKAKIEEELNNENFQEWWLSFLKAYVLTVKIKDYFVQFLDDKSAIQTFIDTGETTERLIGGEGFVMFSTNDGMIKLVDRETFSRINAINNNN